MIRLISDPENNFIVVKKGSSNKSMAISIHEIQPTEDFLKNETISYFMANPEKIFDDKIIIHKCDNPRYRYCVRNGNNRLYVLFVLGVFELDILPYESDLMCICGDEKNMEVAEDTINQGILTWEQLGLRIVPEEKYHRIMEERY